MKYIRGTKAGIGALLVATAMLGGCVVTARPAYGVVTVAPPALVAEVQGVAPGPGFVWIGGYWNWVGGRYVWVGGHWGAGRPGYHWVAHNWVQGPHGGWHLERGHWER